MNRRRQSPARVREAMFRFDVMRARPHAIAAALAVLACAGVPGQPAAGTGTLWGHLRLVPREGVGPGGSSTGAYGDRSLRHVRLFDYSRPGFAVLYLDDPSGPPTSARLALRTTGRRTRFEPAHAATRNGGSILIANQTADVHTISDPAAGVLRLVSPGETLEIATQEAGSHTIHALDVPGVEALVFASPGPCSIVSSQGRFELANLQPGPMVLRAWHPRFPPARLPVEVAAGEVVRIDVKMGVDVVQP